jgi:hypothetical protein
MSTALATYLNDHLAGSVVALQMLQHLKAAHAGTPLEPFLTQIHDEIVADRQQLEGLMQRLDIKQSIPRKVMAWLTEKMTELKLRVDDPGTGSLKLFEALEAVSLGIEGKRSLWRALQAASERTPQLRGVDYRHLEARALDQRERMETVRLEAAKAALAPSN